MLSRHYHHHHYRGRQRKTSSKSKDERENGSSASEMSAIVNYAFGSRYVVEDMPKYKLPEQSTDARVVYSAIKSDMNLDGNPSLNLATFLTTWMEDEALKLATDCIGKNYADMNCYPQSLEIQNRCVSILADLFHADETIKACGSFVVGSTEGCLLGGLAMKKNWQNRRKREGKPIDKPNIIMSSAVQVAWKKFCTFFDVEPRYVNITHDRFVIDPEKAASLIDENTIGVVAILGSTYTGHYEPVKELNAAIERVNREKGLEVGIHVDAASGGFIAPFLSPNLEWDFRVPLVRSINVSGHKYGLCYPGVAWIIWRDESWLPKELIFELHYLGGVEKTFELNFSRSMSPMICQYYNFLRLGRAGYTRIMQSCMNNVRYLKECLDEMDRFDIISQLEDSVPLISMKLKDHVKGYTVYDLQSKLKEDGWMVPAYKLAEDADDIHILRMVIKESFTRDLAENLLDSFKKAISYFEEKERERLEKEAKGKEFNLRVMKEKLEQRENPNRKAGHSVC